MKQEMYARSRKERPAVTEKIVAPKRVNSVVSGDAYFIGLAILIHGMMVSTRYTEESINPFYNELSRIGGFKIVDENE